MKLTLLALSVILAFPVFAQENETETDSEIPVKKVAPKVLKNEVGVMVQQTLGSNYSGSIAHVGVQYKHWIQPHVGYRLNAGYANYQDFYRNPSSSYTGASNDTVYQNLYNTDVNMVFIGAGIEAQRQFYKRVYLFAALEIKAAYGSGRTDTIKQASYKDPANPGAYISDVSTTIYNAPANMNMLNVSFAPSIGAKLQFTRLCVGLELIPTDMTFRSMSYNNGTTTSGTNFQMGEISQRFFMSFRF